jgi:glycosyltransferase involved in cell wall biosynthesis
VSATNEPNRKWQSWDGTNKEAFRTHVLKGIRITRKRDYTYIQPGLWFLLRRLRPDVIIACGFNAQALLAALYARSARKPVIMFNEATAHAERFATRLRTYFRKRVVRLFDAFIASGAETRRFLLSLGADERRCTIAVDAVEDVRERFDYDQIREKAFALRKREKAFALRKSLVHPVVLYSGQLIHRKGVDLLLTAYAASAAKYPSTLLLMGDGELRRPLCEQTVQHNIPHALFAGFQGESEKWAYYLASDIFVLPTREDVWGLVVNEAMLCSLPVVCSQFAGAAADLVRHGENGYIVDPTDTAEFSAALEALLAAPNKAAQMGHASLSIIREFNMDSFANRFLEAIFATVCAKPCLDQT